MNIAAYREANSLTQADLAATLGVTQSTVARWEAGSMPARDMLARIAEITGGQVMPNDWIDIPAVASQDSAA
jgi:transcriptional regulator with XRE-family HTH domain